jgi:preprotein translocase subunit SecG
MFDLLALSWKHYAFSIPLSIISVFLMLIILVQRGRGGGLTGALGGMGGQSAFGTKAGDLFTRITIAVAAVWILLCMLTLKVLNPPSTQVAAPPPAKAKTDGKTTGEPGTTKTSGGKSTPATGDAKSGESTTGESKSGEPKSGSSAASPPATSPPAAPAPTSSAPAPAAPTSAPAPTSPAPAAPVADDAKKNNP